MLSKGIVKFDKDSEGHFLADLRNTSNGRYSSKVRLKEVDIGDSSMTKINSIVQQQQINQIIKELEYVKNGISDILAGQHNDRISKAKSAYSQYLMLDYIEDKAMRDLILSNVINMSTESFCSIAESLAYDISKFNKLNNDSGFIGNVNKKMGMNIEKKQEIADNIFKQMEALYYATMVRTLSISKLDNKLAGIFPINDLNLFLDENITRDTAIMLNGCISKNNNFWTEDYLKRKKKIDRQIKQIKSDILYLK